MTNPQLIIPTRKEDLAAPLRARLLESLSALGVLMVITLLVTRFAPPRNLDYRHFLVQYAGLASVGGLILWLWYSPNAEVPMLRRVEVSMLCIATGLLAFRHLDWLSSEWNNIADHAKSSQLLFLVGDELGFPWSMIIILYGTYLPNDWRRCAIVVGLLALISMMLTLGFAWVHGIDMSEFAPVPRRQFVLTLFGMVVAVSASWKYSALRREASEARMLGPYRILEQLGSGGMGQVYRAEHRLLRRPCALKLIRPELMTDSVTIDRFQREVQVLAGLTHWNIVRVFDYGNTPDGVFYYVMEYLSGLDLDRLIAAHGPQPAARVIHVMRQVCGALHEAHTSGLIHRDIKPSNVLLTIQGRVPDVVKLMDFGLVLAADASIQLTQQGLIVGTPLYMSPEQAAGTAIDLRSDLYSLGLVGYFLLSGKNPFVRSTWHAVMHAQMAETPPPLIDVNPRVDIDLHDVIMTCLEKAPDKRFADAAALEEALARCSAADRWSPSAAADWWRANEPRDLENEKM